MNFKKDEIKSHFEDWIKEQDENWINKNIDDLHHHCFNTDYYIIGTYQAKKWLGDQVFEIIEFIKQYENNNFGEVNTDFSDAEKVVNMYVYIIGEQIVYDYSFEKQEYVEKEIVLGNTGTFSNSIIRGRDSWFEHRNKGVHSKPGTITVSFDAYGGKLGCHL